MRTIQKRFNMARSRSNIAMKKSIIAMNGPMLALSVLILASVFSGSIGPAVGQSEEWQLDVYTQKEPYSGKGLGQPSDAFKPQSLVTLYANLTYNMYPVQNIPVTFNIIGPINPFQNISFSLTQQSNIDGLAETNFTIPFPPSYAENMTFGTWMVNAFTDNASDTLTFKVGYILDLSVFATIEVDPPQGGNLGLQLSILNIGFTDQNLTLIMLIFDGNLINIGSRSIPNLNITQGTTNMTQTFPIPLTATPGLGKVTVALYNSDATLYSPPRSISLYITFQGDINGDGKVDIYDLYNVTIAYGSYLNHAGWNPAPDVDKDNKVDVLDVAKVARNYGKIIPPF